MLSDTQESSAWLTSLLEASGYTTQWKTPQEAPGTLSSLCDYALTVLPDVDQRNLRPGTDQLLKQYVEEYGRSILTIGGSHTYVYGHMLDTAFDEFLPISLNVKEEESATPITLLLVIDCSVSMGQKLGRSTNKNATPLEIAKRGAIKCVTEMNRNDSIGVISFSDFCYVLCDVTSTAEQDKILNGIADIGTVLGTAYGEALREAYQQIQEHSTTERNHVIFISDGNPGDKDYQLIVEQMREEGITMSTIAVGDKINEEIMQELADIGGGSYTLTQDASDLPNIMVTDAVIQQINYLMEGSYKPYINVDDSLLSADVSLPPLNGYIRAQAKPGAELSLFTEENHPLYAYWLFPQRFKWELVASVDERCRRTAVCDGNGRKPDA